MIQKVLIIEDSRPLHILLRSRLAAEPIEIHSAYDGETGLSVAATVQPDLVLLDIDMPVLDGFEVCRRLKANSATMAIPVLFLCGNTSTQQKIAGLELGAVDYIIKPFEPAELRARVRASLRTKYLLDLLAKKAMIDGLTGLWNRTYLEQRLTAELAFGKRCGIPFSCVMADIDNFKAINDRHGHPFGDQVVRHVAQIILDQCRTEDFVCRFGGEEFAILTPGVGATGAVCLAERLRKTVAEKPIIHDGAPIQITCSFGVAGSGAGSTVSPTLASEQAVREAKSNGRNRVCVAPTPETPILRQSA